MKNKVHFIDCGANVGIATEWAVKKYRERLFRVDAFEPEQLNFKTLQENLQKIANRFPIQISQHSAAVWVADEKKQFWLQFWGTRTGSSLLKEKEQIIHKGQSFPKKYLGRPTPMQNWAEEYPDWFAKDDARTPPPHPDFLLDAQITATENINVGSISAMVDCIDLSKWIFENLNKANHNVLKLDIEGAEYKVVDHLLETGASEYIDEWLVEFTDELKVPESFDQGIIDRFMATNPKYTNWSNFKGA